MEKFFILDRNDECICGSGKKYKKCCLTSIENFKRKLLSYIRGEITAEGYEVIRVISMILGMEDNLAKNVIEPKLVAGILNKLWNEEKDIWENNIKFDMMIEKVVNLLRSKEKLYSVRLDGELIYGKDFDDDKEITDFIRNYMENTFFIENSLLDIASSIKTENYTSEELEAAIFAIYSAIHPETRPAFLLAISKSSIMDIEDAEKNFLKLRERTGSTKIDYNDLSALFERYPIFKGYLGSLLRNIADDALKLLFEGKINIQMPFYSVYGIYLKIIIILYNFIVEVNNLKNISKKITKKHVELAVRLLLSETEQFNIFYSALVTAINEKLNKETDASMKEKLENLSSFFTLTLTSSQLEIMQRFVIYTLKNFISSIPFRVEESGLVVNTVETLFTEDFAKSYISYLKEKGLVEEAEYIEKSFKEYLAINTQVTQNFLHIITN